MIKVNCPNCSKQFNVKDEAAGDRGRCPSCRTIFQIPMLEDEPEKLNDLDTLAEVAQKTKRRPRLERGHVRSSPSINVNMPKRSSSLGIVSLIMGCVGFFFCWIPFIGIISIPLSGIGLILAVIGFVVALGRRGSGIGWPIGGGSVSLIALMVAISQVAIITGTAESYRKSVEDANSTQQEVIGVSDSNETSNPKRKTNLEWASAKNIVRQGNISMQITRVVVGKVPLHDGIYGDGNESENDLLSIHIRLTNLSSGKKIQYRSWQGEDIAFTRDYAVLKDNFDNVYKRISFGFSTDIVGNVDVKSLYPRKSIDDVLVFETPVKAAQYLDLELPAKNFEGKGMLRLRIPANMINW